MSKTVKVLISLLIPFSAGAIGSLFTTQSIPTWYSTLNRASFNPPNWVFGPAWTILYILMSISLFLILDSNASKKDKRMPLIIFLIQIVLNALWSIIFFGLRSPLAAFISIIFLWVSILLNIIEFYKIKKIAGLILLPYILWVTFASILNLFVVILN